MPGRVTKHRKDHGQTNEGRGDADDGQRHDQQSPHQHRSRITHNGAVALLHSRNEVGVLVEDQRNRDGTDHEYHGGRSLGLMKQAGFEMLRDRWTEIRPGFVLAGVDDRNTRHQNSRGGDTLSQALAGRSNGAVILLSHRPWQVEKAAEAGVGLMLCGHTHGGQIWPFDYLVRRRYPLLEGRYEVDRMTVIVSRGSGTWGPRMRLWRPGEILRVTLRGMENNHLTETFISGG